jgi:hypothetical protein
MFDIMIQNPMLWVNIAIPFAIGLFLVLTDHRYDIKEFGIQLGVTVVVLTGAYMILFATTTKLYSKVYYNSSVSKITYYEEWTELVHYTEQQCRGSGKDQTCTTVYKTRHDYHAPYWKLTNTIGGTLDIEQSEYSQARSKYGATFKDLSRSDKVSYGDGNAYVVVPTDIVPVVSSSEEINYVKAANNIVRADTLPQKIEQYKKAGQLMDYPELMMCDYGSRTIHRVITAKGAYVNTSKNERELENFASVVGPTKQVNPLIYIVKGQDRDFTAVLKAYWVNGSKNDSILVVNVDDNGTIVWSDIIAWTKNTDFLVDNTKIYTGMSVSSDEFVKQYEREITLHFTRTHMKDFKYLESNIDLAFSVEVWIIVINLILSGIAFWFFINNETFGSRMNSINGYINRNNLRKW